MWFKLANANFGSNSLGKMDVLADAWNVTYSVSGGITKTSGSGSVAKGGTLTAQFTLSTGATFTSATLSPSSAGTVTHSTSGSTVTVTVTNVKANCTLSVVATGGSTGGTGGGSTTTPTTTLTYTSRQSSAGISKTTGEYLSSSTGYVNIYDNIDASKIHYATSYAPSSTSDNACVCYYTSDGTFISAESSNDWGIHSIEYTNQELTIPSNTYTIKLFGRTQNQEAVLSVANLIIVTHSAINEKSNLTKSNGALGTSTSGVVKTYNDIDASKTYLADGFCPNATGTAAFVCYYDNAGAFISAQDGNDFGLSSQAASRVALTIPSSTATIKLFGQSGSSDPYLYISD